jgi:hypothetical protein
MNPVNKYHSADEKKGNKQWGHLNMDEVIIKASDEDNV